MEEPKKHGVIYRIRTTYKKDDGTICEQEFKSMSECSKFYGCSLTTMGKLIRDEPVYLKSIPFGIKVEIILIEKLNVRKKEKILKNSDWKCDICNTTVLYQCKTEHRNSRKHMYLEKKMNEPKKKKLVIKIKEKTSGT
jgi:hypothetical protein